MQRANTADAGRFDALRQAGIDTAAGLGYCQNDTELYAMILHEFVQSAAVKKRDLEWYFDAHDAKNYGILVHALKSASRTIGAETLASEAATLEKAADADRWANVTNGHAALLAHFDAVVKQIADATGDTVSADSAPEEEILEFFPENCNV